MTQPAKTYKYYELIMAAFVAVLLCSNLIGPAKVVQLDLPIFGKVDFGAGNLFFPLPISGLPWSFRQALAHHPKLCNQHLGVA